MICYDLLTMQSRALERIPKRSLTDAVFDQLVGRIVAGRWKAGDALPPERQLCAELGVSRTAVREALSRLVQLRLIVVRHGGETRVLDLRATGGLDLLPHLLRAEGELATEVIRAGVEMRAALAPELARVAAMRGGDETAAALAPIVEAMVGERDDLAALQARSLEFWAVVVAGTENLAYQLAFNTLRDAFLGMREAVAVAMADELRDQAGYGAIAAAIGAGDGEAAAAAARAHIARGVARLTGLARPRRGQRTS
jgi:DNA-binding FadR family transcriptional regulator